MKIEGDLFDAIFLWSDTPDLGNPSPLLARIE
jgi:hypothetical protein